MIFHRLYYVGIFFTFMSFVSQDSWRTLSERCSPYCLAPLLGSVLFLAGALQAEGFQVELGIGFSPISRLIIRCRSKNHQQWAFRHLQLSSHCCGALRLKGLCLLTIPSTNWVFILEGRRCFLWLCLTPEMGESHWVSCSRHPQP